MKRWSWQTTLSSLLVAIVLGRWLARLRKPSPIRPRQLSTANPERRGRLTRDDVLHMIEEDCGRYRLDFSERDLSDLDLSIEFVTKELEKDQHKRTEGQDVPYWVSKLTGGMRLVRADFRGTKFKRTNLKGANFWRSDLTGVNFRGAGLEDVRLEETKMQSVSLYLARLQNTLFDARQLQGAIWEEEAGRVREARAAYRALKNNFSGIGRYGDASWAYIKERQMGKKMHWPPSRACECYPEELAAAAADGSSRILHLARFYSRHLALHLTDWIVELTCGYGEKPVRTLVWALAVVLIFPVLYWLSGGIVSVNVSTLTWLDYMNYSLGAFTTIGFARFETETWVAETLTSLEALLGISGLALLMYTLGNRISRSS